MTDFKNRDDQDTLIIKTATNLNEQLGRPDPMLVVLNGSRVGHRIELKPGALIIGRGLECDLPLPDDRSASRVHCRLFTELGRWYIEDLGSTNGTHIERVRLTERHRLRDGDYIYVGESIFKYLGNHNPEASWFEEIHQLAILDALTRVPNRRALMEFADRELARARRHGRPLSVMMFDLDHFKQINDRFGHLAGDAVLRELSERISGEVRREELFARYGGDEFTVVLPETRAKAALKKAGRLVEIVNHAPVHFGGRPMAISISVGVAELTPTLRTVDELLGVADGALYRAKSKGRNRASA